MKSTPGFAATLASFTAYLRDPVVAPPPEDIEPARAAVYARLVERNVESLLARSFPVLRSLCEDAQWHALVRDFLGRHRARTPLFPGLPRELVDFLAAGGRAQDPAWFAELADYECLETECAQDPCEIGESVALDADLLDGVPVVNPITHLRAYRHPVHTIAPGHLPVAEPVWLVVYRRRDDRVAFLRLNEITAALVGLLIRNAEARSGRTLLQQVAHDLDHPHPARLLAAGHELLEELRRRELVLGAYGVPDVP